MNGKGALHGNYIMCMCLALARAPENLFFGWYDMLLSNAKTLSTLPYMSNSYHFGFVDFSSIMTLTLDKLHHNLHPYFKMWGGIECRKCCVHACVCVSVCACMKIINQEKPTFQILMGFLHHHYLCFQKFFRSVISTCIPIGIAGNLSVAITSPIIVM